MSKKKDKHSKDQPNEVKENVMNETKSSSTTTAEELAQAANAVSETQEASEEEKQVKLTEIDVNELSKLRDEAQDSKNKYLMTLAELENSRKRLQKEKHDLTQYAMQDVICELLQPLDTFETALNASENANDEIKNWALGFQMILKQFSDILSNHNVNSFSSEGKLFDPHHHEAMETEETDEYPEGTIIKEFVKGYKMGDRTIRPAKVKVAKAPAKKEDDEASTEEKE